MAVPALLFKVAQLATEWAATKPLTKVPAVAAEIIAVQLRSVRKHNRFKHIIPGIGPHAIPGIFLLISACKVHKLM